MSLRLRVALLTAAAVALVEVAIVVAIYAFVSYRLYSQAEQDLRGIASVIVPVVANTGDLPVRAQSDVERPPFLPRLIAADGRILSTRSTLELPVTARARDVVSGRLASLVETLRVGTTDYYVLTVPASQGRGLQVAHSLADAEQVLQQLLSGAIAFAVAGIVLAPFAGAAVASGALLPLRRLSGVTRRVAMTGDLTQRVGARGSDELAVFAKSFDAMLDRLEAMVAEVERARRMQRQLVADASHELRAPLATLRANVELLSLDSDAPVGDRETLLAETRIGIQELTTLVGQVIDLAREDERVHQRAPVRLDRVVRDELERMQRRYPAVEFAARLEETTVTGDVEALTRAITNLLDNAGKWSPAGGTVEVLLRAGVLEVRDEGPGIDGADLPHVFERFYRGARTKAIPGSGLGLAIVAQVMAAHGGNVAVESRTPAGTIFRATF
jgi:two-component system sensor histidine kinase MprB